MSSAICNKTVHPTKTHDAAPPILNLEVNAVSKPDDYIWRHNHLTHEEKSALSNHPSSWQWTKMVFHTINISLSNLLCTKTLHSSYTFSIGKPSFFSITN
jgi:hypothetical protein